MQTQLGVIYKGLGFKVRNLNDTEQCCLVKFDSLGYGSVYPEKHL